MVVSQAGRACRSPLPVGWQWNTEDTLRRVPDLGDPKYTRFSHPSMVLGIPLSRGGIVLNTAG